jgi:Uma2 family endonuclease
MSVACYQSKSSPDKGRLLTIAEFAALPSETPSGPVRHELEDGVLIKMPPPGDRHSVIETNLIYALKVFGEAKGYGKARVGEVGIILRRAPARRVGTDPAVITSASLPVRRSPEGYLETIPSWWLRSSADTIGRRAFHARLKSTYSPGCKW